MKQVLLILTLFVFSFIFYSCDDSKKEESKEKIKTTITKEEIKAVKSNDTVLISKIAANTSTTIKVDNSKNQNIIPDNKLRDYYQVYKSLSLYKDYTNKIITKMPDLDIGIIDFILFNDFLKYYKSSTNLSYDKYLNIKDPPINNSKLNKEVVYLYIIVIICIIILIASNTIIIITYRDIRKIIPKDTIMYPLNTGNSS